MAEYCVGVFGANGHTGRFVAAELKRRGLAARWIGRNRAALSELQATLGHGEIRVASVQDPASLLRAFDGLDAVINCAGPFFDTCGPVVAAALAAGCHYLDVNAEQVTVLDTISTFDDPAKAAGRVVLPAMAFFGGLADLLATSIIDGGTDVDAIEIAVALELMASDIGNAAHRGAKHRDPSRCPRPRFIRRPGALADIDLALPATLRVATRHLCPSLGDHHLVAAR